MAIVLFVARGKLTYCSREDRAIALRVERDAGEAVNCALREGERLFTGVNSEFQIVKMEEQTGIRRRARFRITKTEEQGNRVVRRR